MSLSIEKTELDSRDLSSIETIEKAAILFSIFALACSIILMPTFQFVGGTIAGAIVGIVNFRLIRLFVVKLLSQSEQTSHKGAKLFVKMLILLLGMGFVVLFLKLNVIAFAIGFSGIVFGIIFEGIKSMFI